MEVGGSARDTQERKEQNRDIRGLCVVNFFKSRWKKSIDYSFQQEKQQNNVHDDFHFWRWSLEAMFQPESDQQSYCAMI